MRRLAIGAHGTDVTHLQQAINARAHARGLATIKVDGQFGRSTRTAAERVARALGAREDTIAKRPLTIGVQRIIRWPATRTPLQLKRARDRRHRHPGGGGGHARRGAFGVDWAWGTPRISQLAAAGVKFACRYLSHDPTKNLTLAQATALAGQGIDSVLVWETTANRALSGYSGGVADARAALEQARGCGMPGGRPIYFAVDFQVIGAEARARVKDYFRGVRLIIDGHRVGAYGGVDTIRLLFDANLIGYGWQTYAWSGGRWDSRAQLRQYSNGHTLAGVSCDYNTAMADDFGQWRPE